MKKIEYTYNNELIDYYVKKYNIQDIFSEDMKVHMKLRVFHKGDLICRMDEELTELFFFVKGKAKVYTTLKNGKSLLLCFYTSFQVVGDVQLFNDIKATANIQCIEESHCISFPMKVIKSILDKDTRFLKFIAETLGGKLNRISNNSSINLLYPLEQRLASYLLVTSHYEQDGKLIVEENLTHVAELLGISYRHLLRTLNGFVQEGIIKKQGTLYSIEKEETLEALAADIYTY